MSKRLITGNAVEKDMSALRRGLSLPNHPARQAQTLRRMQANVSDGSAMRAAVAAANREKAASFRGGMARRGSLQMALEKPHSPLDRFTQSSIPHNINDKEERMKIRDLCRTYYKVHNLIPLLIDIYCRFPIQGMTIDHEDSDLKEFYETLFFDNLEYETFLIDFGREFFTVGEVSSIATFSELLGIWESEQIINPDDLTVSRSAISKELRYHLAVPEHIREIIKTKRPRSDYDILVREYPEYIDSVNREERGQSSEDVTGPGFEISNILLSRLVNNVSPWELYGTPHMLRVFQNLNLEEGLLAAQKAIADRLYSPLILAKLGSDNLGDGGPWIPDMEELDAFTDTMQQAMSADFRFLTYHYGIEIESVFGRENVPNLDNDFDRIERKILQAWGIGESLISGSSNGSYASSALNSELVNQLMSSYQKFLKKHFKKRCEVVAEAQGHFEVEKRGDSYYTVYEEYESIDPDTGESKIKRRPKLATPELEFKSIALRDEETERQFLLALRQSGIPISMHTILETVDKDFTTEIDQIAEENADLIIAQQELQGKLVEILQQRGLQLTPELITAIAQQTQQPMPQPGAISNGSGLGINTPPNAPGIIQDQAAMAAAQQNAMTLPVMPQGAEQAQAPAAPQGPPPAPSGPQLAGPQLLPQNQLSQRPEISSQQAPGMPRRAKSSMRWDPSVVGMRELLTEESVDELAKERPWTRSLRGRK